MQPALGRARNSDEANATFVSAALFRRRSHRVVLNRQRARRAAAEQAPARVVVDHEVQLGAGFTVIGLATRGIMMIESCKVMAPTENQIPVGWNG